MPLDNFVALVVFALVASITPGPNNLMLLASGVNFGFRRTIPHMAGVAFGFAGLLLATGFGLGALLSAVPSLDLALKIVGGAYLLYLAWRIAGSRSIGKVGQKARRPLSFLEAAGFQFVNPKAWVMALTAMALYANGDAPMLSGVLVTAAFLLVAAPCITLWTGFGQALRGWLADPVRLKWFNIAMGAALALTLVAMVR